MVEPIPIGVTGIQVSETAKARPRLSEFCTGSGLDIGFGGDPIVPWAITMDMEKPYTQVGSKPQQLYGDCRVLPFLSGSLDFIYSSHLIEDFYWDEIRLILKEWIRVLKPSGRLVLYQPDQQVYLEHCRRTGQGINLAHKEQDFSLSAFKRRILSAIPHQILTEFNEPQEGTGYSFGLALQVNI